MKLKLIGSIASSIVMLVLIAVLINSCKKENKNSTAAEEQNANADDLLADAKSRVADQIMKYGKSVTVPVNEKIANYYISSKTGDLISREQLIQNRASTNGIHQSNANGIKEDFLSACNYDPYFTTLTSYTLTENCLNSPNGFQVSWTYQISTDDNLVATNPFNSRQTKGYLYIYNSSGTLLYSNTSITTVSFSTPVADPADPGNYLINVTFTSPWLANSYFGLIYSTKLGGVVQTDCGDAETEGISLYSPTSYQYPSTNPCERIDPIYASNNPTTHVASVLGEDPTGVCAGSPGFTYPYWQEVQYSIDGGAYTNSLLSYSSSNCLFTNFLGKYYVDPVGAGTLNLNYSGLSTGSHTLKFIARNHYYTSIVTPIGCTAGQNKYPLPTSLPMGWVDCSGTWSSPITLSVTR